VRSPASGPRNASASVLRQELQHADPCCLHPVAPFQRALVIPHAGVVPDRIDLARHACVGPPRVGHRQERAVRQVQARVVDRLRQVGPFNASPQFPLGLIADAGREFCQRGLQQPRSRRGSGTQLVDEVLKREAEPLLQGLADECTDVPEGIRFVRRIRMPADRCRPGEDSPRAGIQQRRHLPLLYRHRPGRRKVDAGQDLLPPPAGAQLPAQLVICEPVSLGLPPRAATVTAGCDIRPIPRPRPTATPQSLLLNG
jgi:hypothetical protein